MFDEDSIGALFGIFLLGAACIVGFQCLYWLRFGEWFPLPIGAVWLWLGFSYPTVEWVGVQKLINLAMSVPLSVFVVALGFVATWFALSIAKEIEGWREERRREREARLAATGHARRYSWTDLLLAFAVASVTGGFLLRAAGLPWRETATALLIVWFVGVVVVVIRAFVDSHTPQKQSNGQRRRQR